FPEPHTHYAEVEMHISDIEVKELHLKMAVWSPGSYLIREFQKNIDFVESRTKNQESRRLDKIDKNTWNVNIQNENEIAIRYKTYCYEESVRTNFVDEAHALINGAPTFLYVAGFENNAIDVEIIPYSNWKNISTALPQKDNNKWLRTASNINELIDSPIEIGNHVSYFFTAATISHELAIYGESNCNNEKLIADLKAIIEVETNIFGSHPCKEYVFIIHNTEKSFGGLEHLNSSVNHITRWSYDTKHYQRPISLLAHEYFHLWNVKRIRPFELSSFNYNEENYTKLLWFFEGVTSYYDDYICYRAGVTKQDDFLDIVAQNINTVFNTAGIQTQSLAEASFDTWLKYYRQNENSINSQISYYTKGSIVAMLLDFIILDATDGERNIDYVMHLLYQKYLAKPEIGFTEKEIQETFETTANQSLQTFFDDFIYGVEPINIETYFEKIGIQLKNTTIENNIYLGIETQYIDRKLVVTKVEKGFGAYDAGLNVEDELIAVDNFRVIDDFKKIYAHKNINDTIDVLVSRKGILKTIKIELTNDKKLNYKLEKLENSTEKQQKLLKKWLHLK
ncbi:MAG TPA: PDZ domain-containing protein, partial [Chitinophagales bacterium]|nr:PDZ domain-containing protein [Chitinophagales bacterium]